MSSKKGGSVELAPVISTGLLLGLQEYASPFIKKKGSNKDKKVVSKRKYTKGGKVEDAVFGSNPAPIEQPEVLRPPAVTGDRVVTQDVELPLPSEKPESGFMDGGKKVSKKTKKQTEKKTDKKVTKKTEKKTEKKTDKKDTKKTEKKIDKKSSYKGGNMIDTDTILAYKKQLGGILESLKKL
jgi:hypothetical protein